MALLNELDDSPGQVITFYSYKGGTGRSMAVANLSCLLGRELARTSKRVLVMDWDLEAPGLHRYFSARCDLPEFRQQEGVANYFHALRSLLEESSELLRSLTSTDGCKLLQKLLPIERYITPDVVPGVDFMRAGLFDDNYPRLVGSFDWITFYNRFGGVIRTFREMLAENYAYILIDSRTGITDVSGICTTLLPEKLVGVFVPNRQSLDGLSGIIRQAIDYRSKADDFRPLSVFPLPSRVENAEKDLKDEWRITYQKAFQELFKAEYQIDNCDLTEYFTEVSLPHTSYYAYGEKIAVLEDRVRDAQSLSTAYRSFFHRLMRFDTAWELDEPEVQPVSAAAPSAPASVPVKAPEPLYDAFLSYARADQADVTRIETKLRELGVRCFLDKRDLLAGEEWAPAIERAMKSSRTAVVFFGPSGDLPWSDQSSLIALEGFAKQPDKRVIPVVLPGASILKLRLPTFLGNILAVEIESLRDQNSVQRIARAILAARPDSEFLSSLPPMRSGSRGWLRIAAAGAVAVLGIASGIYGIMHRSGVSSTATNATTAATEPSHAGPSTTPTTASHNPASTPPAEANPVPTVTPANEPPSTPTPRTGRLPSSAWCYQELGTPRSGAWALEAGKYGVYCHASELDCLRASRGAQLTGACALIENLSVLPWSAKLHPNGLYGSWYLLNLDKPLAAPIPSIEPSSLKNEMLSAGHHRAVTMKAPTAP